MDVRIDPLPHNHALAEHLRAIAYYEQLYEISNYEFRASSYVAAASLISKLDYELLTPAEARSYRGIGVKISKRVEQFSLTGTSTKLEKLRARDPERDEVVSDLSSVVGLSVNMANELYDQDIRSVADLRENVELMDRVGLSPIYLSHATRFLEVIPREEIGLFREQVRGLLRQRRITVTSTGPYRRGEPATSIDLLFTHFREEHLGIRQVLIDLASLLKDGISLSSTHFSGLSHSRRLVTARLVRESSYAPALLYTTGPIPFVYDVRTQAEEQGRHLDEYEERTRSGKNITPISERDLLSSLDLDYTPPTRRQ